MTESVVERYKDAIRRGQGASMGGRLGDALEAFGEASRIAPDRGLPHAAIGGILVRLGRPDDALAAFDRALELSPREETALRGRADVLASMGRRVESAEMLDRLTEVLETAGRVPEACDAACQALALAESRDRRREIERLADRLRQAPADDEVAARALEQARFILEPPVDPGPPPDGFALGAAAEQAMAEGDVGSARNGFLAAAAAHRLAGRSTAAIDACYLALEIAPDNPDLHMELTELYLDRGWRSLAVDKLVLIGRLAVLGEDRATRDRMCRFATDRSIDDPRLTELCV